jgi:hypothetical protein
MAFLVPINGLPIFLVPAAAVPSPQTPDLYGTPPPQSPAFASFSAVDTDRNGRVSWSELKVALSSAFGPVLGSTARLLVRVNDTSGEGAGLRFSDYEGLYAKVTAWRAWFDARKEKDPMDAFGAGFISVAHLKENLSSLGLPLDATLTALIIEDYLPEDGTDKVHFPECLRLFAEVDALSHFLRSMSATEKTSEGKVALTPQHLVTRSTTS